MRKYIISLICIFFIGLGLYIIPNLINFMENQNDILKIKNEISQTFSIQEKKLEIENAKVDFNIPLPDDVKAEMIKREEIKKEAERLEKERLAKIEAERLAKEAAEKAEQEKQIELKRQKEEQDRATQIAKTNNVTSRSEETSRDSSNWIKFTATAYCGCTKCCGKSTGRTASGTTATQGRTVAMPSSYAFGTKIEIQGMGTYTVEDRGGAINGNRIDIFFSNHQFALNFGKKTVYLRVVK